jgi:hypothetical protein
MTPSRLLIPSLQNIAIPLNFILIQHNLQISEYQIYAVEKWYIYLYVYMFFIHITSFPGSLNATDQSPFSPYTQVTQITMLSPFLSLL